MYSRWDRSPDIIEDQVTYPIVTAMLGAPKVKDVRGFSDFGYSYVYIVFEEGTDIYWARSRTLEYLSGVLPDCRRAFALSSGPMRPASAGCFSAHSSIRPADRAWRSCDRTQDWRSRVPESRCRAWPRSPPSAASCGSIRCSWIGIGCVPCNMSIAKVTDAVRAGNNDVGGRLVELTGAEYMVRGRGYAEIRHGFNMDTRSVARQSARLIIVLARRNDRSGVPVRVRMAVGTVTLGPDLPAPCRGPEWHRRHGRRLIIKKDAPRRRMP